MPFAQTPRLRRWAPTQAFADQSIDLQHRAGSVAVIVRSQSHSPAFVRRNVLVTHDSAVAPAIRHASLRAFGLRIERGIGAAPRCQSSRASASFAIAGDVRTGRRTMQALHAIRSPMRIVDAPDREIFSA
ncbi:MAG: hypothetical protein ACREP7_21120 [Lysobacter sp.]